MVDEYTASRYRAMRLLLQECDAEDKVLLDLGAGPNPVSSGIGCRRRILFDIRADFRPSAVCNFSEAIPLRDSCVDVAVAGEILEHIAHSRRFLKEIRRVLKAGGTLIVSVPNIVSLKYRLLFALGRIPAHAARADYTYPENNPASQWGHIRDYSFGEVRSVLADQGFVVQAERSIGMHWNGRRIAPPWVMPVTFSDNVIVKAVLCKGPGAR